MRAPFRAVVITGASSGLGAALARTYAGPGVALGLTARSGDEGGLEAVAAACRAAGATVDSAIIDVADRDAMTAWLERFDDGHPVDLAIANAGISGGPEPDSMIEDIAMTSRQVMVNLLGAVHTVAPLVPRMGARGRGRIAFIASVAAYRGIPDALGYSASKAGLRAYGEALRARIEPLGIGVTVVCPGFFESEMSDRWTCPQPLRVSGERAAGKVKRGIDRGRRRVTFPLPFAIVMRCLDLLPAGIGDSILRRWRGQVRGE